MSLKQGRRSLPFLGQEGLREVFGFLREEERCGVGGGCRFLGGCPFYHLNYGEFIIFISFFLILVRCSLNCIVFLVEEVYF